MFRADIFEKYHHNWYYIFLTNQVLALHGDNESLSESNVKIPGNSLAILKLISKYNNEMQAHLDKTKFHAASDLLNPHKVTYLIGTIQNEIIDISYNW